MGPGMDDDEDINGEASKLAMADIMALVDKSRGQRLRSKLPKPAEQMVPVAPEGQDGDLLAELATLLEQKEPTEQEC